MDPLNETPFSLQLAPLLMWIKVIEVCASMLLLLALVTLLATWVGRRSWRIRFLALLPLAAGIAAGIAAHALHSRYVYWTTSVPFGWLPSIPHPSPQSTAIINRWLRPFEEQFTSDMHTATLLGWGIVVVTAMLVALGLLGAWRLFTSERHQPLPTSSASEP
jgi:hypothetical protein